MKLTRSRIIAAIAFLCLLAWSWDVYDPVMPKTAGTVLRAIEEKTDLPVTRWVEAITGQTIAKPAAIKAEPKSMVDAAMEKMLEQQEVEEAAKALMTLKNIKFTGVTILGDMELRGMVEPFLNTPMTYEQMLEIGMVVEQYYRKNNYLARAILPPQDLTDGVLTVEVIESVFSKVEIEQELADLPNTQAHVEAIIEAQQKTGEPLNTQSLDRALALANDLPGMSVQGSLRQGREAGETELLLKMYQGRTRQTELTVDNAGSRSTGFMRVMASLTWFNPNDLADLLNVVAVHTRGSDYARMAYSLPVGFDGWRFGLNASAQLVAEKVAGFYHDWSPAFTYHSGQLEDKYLDTSEKMQLSGINSLRAYPAGEGEGTDAELIRLELWHQLEGDINFYTFYDWGQIWIQHGQSKRII